MPPHLNHMGNDICRSLLEFSQSKPLGERGLYWLKIHLANKLGFDKLSFKDRVEKIEEMLPKLRQTIENPIQNDWWLENEDCWQALAVMKELVEALNMENPEEYMR